MLVPLGTNSTQGLIHAHDAVTRCSNRVCISCNPGGLIVSDRRPITSPLKVNVRALTSIARRCLVQQRNAALPRPRRHIRVGELRRQRRLCLTAAPRASAESSGLGERVVDGDPVVPGERSGSGVRRSGTADHHFVFIQGKAFQLDTERLAELCFLADDNSQRLAAHLQVEPIANVTHCAATKYVARAGLSGGTRSGKRR
jgi:hypothetical protein